MTDFKETVLACLLAILITLVFWGAALLLPTSALAQHAQTDQLDAFAFEALTLSNAAASAPTAATVSPTTAPGAKAAVCTLEGTVSARYRYDGTSPTTAEGHLTATPTATAPVPVVILGVNNVVRFRVIATGAGAPVLRCTYLR